MNSKTRNIVLHMVMAFVVCILLVQLWLFTEALEGVHAQDQTITVVAMVVSGMGCLCVWQLIRYFLVADKNHGT
jgi:hypothetical protein